MTYKMVEIFHSCLSHDLQNGRSDKLNLLFWNEMKQKGNKSKKADRWDILFIVALVTMLAKTKICFHHFCKILIEVTIFDLCRREKFPGLRQ